MLLALQGLCESKPSDYVAWRSFLDIWHILGIPRWFLPILGTSPVVGFYPIFVVVDFHPEKSWGR